MSGVEFAALVLHLVKIVNHVLLLELPGVMERQVVSTPLQAELGVLLWCDATRVPPVGGGEADRGPPGAVEPLTPPTSSPNASSISCP